MTKLRNIRRKQWLRYITRLDNMGLRNIKIPHRRNVKLPVRWQRRWL